MKNKTLYTALAFFMLLFAIGFSTYHYGVSKAIHTIEYREVKITQKKIDSIKSTVKPIEKQIVVYQEKRESLKKKEKEIIYPKEDCKEIVSNLKDQLANCDTIVQLKDTIIYKERLVIEYKDKIIEKMVLPKPKPWGIGIQAGYGLNGKDLCPYVGVGISYNLIRF